jgi:hypothetical protein
MALLAAEPVGVGLSWQEGIFLMGITSTPRLLCDNPTPDLLVA